MVRESIEATLREERAADGYLFPAYADYCFANVPHTVTALLGSEPTGRPLPPDVLDGASSDPGIVLVVLIDGFGLRPWKRLHTEYPFLASLTERGRVTPLTTVYPSETTAAMTTFHTGVPPAVHGGIGWNIYEPTIEASFEALNFAKKDGTSPAMDFAAVFDAHSIYHGLAEDGVDVRHVTAYPRELGGVETHPFEALTDLPATLAGALESAEPPAYVFTYIGAIDAVAHEAGTRSPAFRETLRTVCSALTDAVDRIDPATAAETLLAVTADHGHVDTDPTANVDLATVPGIEANLATDGDGEPVRFAGNPRNVHLHLAEGSRDRVRTAIESAPFEARVFTREEVLTRELFGTPPSTTFERRLPDLVVVPKDRSVWWGGPEPGELEYVGMHGGLNPAEMLVPFAVADLADIGR